MLVGESKITHSYPHCWRCHNPVIFRATEQWFIGLDQRQSAPASALAEIEKVKWIPAWGRERMHDMVAERPDWCISRQRFWGVPLIVFYCDACGKQLEDFDALRHVLPFFEREGADAWYTHSAEELASAGNEVLVRRREVAQGIGHSRRVVRFRLHASRGAQRDRTAPGPRTCISKAPTSIAAGFRVRC